MNERTESNDSGVDQNASKAPVLSGMVVHWRNERELERLLNSWPVDDDRFPLVVVDNSGTAPSSTDPFQGVQWQTPSSNVGFAGGVNLGVGAINTPWVLLLNPDVQVSVKALEAFAVAASNWGASEPTLGAIAPRMIDSDGCASQFRWQLRPLTRRSHLLAQCFFFSVPRGPVTEPADRALVGQPAAAALLVRRSAFDQVGGFDERFHPAWFEDVDFAHRLASADYVARYLREVEVVHEGGASVPSLGFARFLRIYYRNLQRFAEARGWPVIAAVAPLLVATAATLRVPLCLLRKPKAARSKALAAKAFAQLALSAISAWRWPGEARQ